MLYYVYLDNIMGYKTVPNVLESVWMLSKLGVFWAHIGTQNLNYKEIGIVFALFFAIENGIDMLDGKVRK